MTTVIMNNAQAEVMRQTADLVEVRDESGAVLGYFAPVKLEHAQAYAELAARASASPRTRRSGYTGEEVAAHLKSLEERQ